MNTKIVDIKELIMDKGTYPREETDWRTIATYSNAMKAGAKFPPIVVGVLSETKEVKGHLIVTHNKYLIDGWHRIGAYKANKITHIEAERIDVASLKDIYLEAIKRNIGHGKPFQPSERIKIFVTMKEMGIDKKMIEQVIMMPIKTLEKMSAKRIAFTSSGREVILKPSLKAEAGKIVSNDFYEKQEEMQGGLSQIETIDNFIIMLEGKMFDTNNPSVYGKLLKINNLLRELFKK